MIKHTHRAKLRWRCRRGMLELDVLLQQFCDSYLEQLDDEHMQNFEILLNYSDPELYDLLMGRLLIDAPKGISSLVKLIQHHHYF